MARKTAVATAPIAIVQASRTAGRGLAKVPRSRKAEAADADQRDPIERDRVANGVAPALRADQKEEHRERACGECEAVVGRGPRAGWIERVAQRKSGRADEQIGQAFEANADRKPGQRAGRERGPAHAIGPDGCGDGQHRERDLDIVMIDPPGAKLMKRRQADEREQQRDQRGLAAGKTPGDRRRAGHGRYQPQHRPHRAHQPLGERCLEEQAEEPQREGQAGIDQARPVRLIAGRDAPLVQVVPALPAKPVMQLREPHRIVGVEQIDRGVGPVLRDELHHDERPGEADEACERRLARGCIHTRLFRGTALNFL